jgi:hypothetical protein
LSWLNDLEIEPKKGFINIHAGFDETSALLKHKFPEISLTVFDFYDPVKHTEVSVERARRAYPVYPGTKAISTTNVPLNENSVDYIFLIFSVHEIRNMKERISFLSQLKNSLREDGKIIVTEHLRDPLNFIAYNIGFLHFFSKNTWEYAFKKAELSLSKEFKITPFISVFVLEKHGTAS